MLQLNQINVVFNKNTPNQKIALNNISLDVQEGDFVTIIGGNGAGKSTLLNTIAGNIKVDSGKITLADTDITNMPDFKRAKYISRVFQDPMKGTAAAMNIEENLALAYNRGKRHTLRWNVTKPLSVLFKEKVATLNLGLEDRMSTKVSLLSGGQRQALTLLMATLNSPHILLLDEHTAALDPRTAQQILQITADITAQNNQTTLMITHNMHDALRFGNRLIMMNEGQIIMDVSGQQKSALTVQDLLDKFAQSKQADDRILLS